EYFKPSLFTPNRLFFCLIYTPQLRLARVFHAMSGYRNHSSTTKKALNNIEVIESGTQALIVDINALRQALNRRIAEAGNDNSLKVELNEKEQLKMNLLSRKIAAYCDSLRIINTPATAIKLVPSGIAALNNSQAFSLVYSAEASLGETLASLAHMESRILAFEASALQEQSLVIGCYQERTYNAIGVMASAESNTVSAGSTYKATMMLSTMVRPEPLEMRVNGRVIPINKDGQGEVSFIASPEALGKQQKTDKKWVGTIRTKWHGKDTIYRVYVPYTIVRPSE
ncbi:hypothetical protein, partial [Hymenobacter saemangeumensis]|uniref:hypothetical protein n=1 Tax=Hymenobacter saemangeumensis TaxID=1084522 RepID=UPI0031E7757A